MGGKCEEQDCKGEVFGGHGGNVERCSGANNLSVMQGIKVFPLSADIQVKGVFI
jgi:hypothetical protein